MDYPALFVGLTPQEAKKVFQLVGGEFTPTLRVITTPPPLIFFSPKALPSQETATLKALQKKGHFMVALSTEPSMPPFADYYLNPEWEPLVLQKRIEEIESLFLPLRRKLLETKAVPLTPDRLASALFSLVKEKKSGAIHCDDHQKELTYYVEEGCWVCCRTNYNAHHFGNWLVQGGQLKASDFARTTRLFFITGQRIGECLLLEGLLQKEELKNLLHQHQQFLGAQAFTWQQGDLYRISFPFRVPADQHFSLDYPKLILEALNREGITLPKSTWKKEARITQLKGFRQDLPLTPSQAYLLQTLQHAITLKELEALIPQNQGLTKDLQILQWANLVSITEPSPLMDLVEKAEKAQKQTFYEVLGVPADASSEVIRKNYFQLARTCHPDRFSALENFSQYKELIETYFATINEAYQILSDPQSRREYDQMLLSGKKPKSVEETSPKVLLQQARTFVQQKNYPQALQKLHELLYLGVEDGEIHKMMGICLASEPGKMKEAENHLLEALKTRPRDGEIHLLLAKIYRKAGLTTRAKRHLQTLLEILPGHPEGEALLQELNLAP